MRKIHIERTSVKILDHVQIFFDPLQSVEKLTYAIIGVIGVPHFIYLMRMTQNTVNVLHCAQIMQ